MRVEEQIVNQETALGFLLEYSSQLLDCRTLDDIFELAVRTSKERLHTRISSAFLFSKEGKLERRYTAGLSNSFPIEVYERGQGLVGRTAGTPTEFGQPHLSTDMETDSRIQGDPVVTGYVAAYNQAVLSEYGLEERATSTLAVPLNGVHRTFGVLRVVNKLDPETGRVSGKPFTEVDRDWLVMLSRLTANAVVNAKKQNQLSTLATILQLIDEETDEKIVLDRIAKTLVDSSSTYVGCLIQFLDRKTDELEVIGHSKNYRRLPGIGGRRDVRVKVGEGVCGQVFSSGQNKVIRNLGKDPEGFLFPAWVAFNGFVSLICLTIKNRRGGPDFGTLQLFTKYEYIFDQDDIQYLENVAHQISTVLWALQNNSVIEAALTLGAVRFDEMNESRICEILAEKTSEMMGTPVTCVWLRRRVQDQETLILEGIYGAEIQDRSAFEIERSDGGLSWHSITKAEKYLAEAPPEYPYTGSLYDLQEDIQDPKSEFRHPEFARQNRLDLVISMPLVLDKEVLGVINTYASRRWHFYERAIYLLKNLALSGAMALHNAELTQRMGKILDNILATAQLANPGTVALSFSHDISHTMNHVNALLSSLIELIPRQVQEEDPGRSVIQSLTVSTDYLRDLFRSLVRYAGGKPLRYVPTQLSEILSYVHYIYSVRLQHRRITLKINIEGGDLWIECDRNQIEQMLINLFNNSIYAITKKMSKGGQIEISARLLDESFVEIRFKDNGIGMTPDERQYAFEPFFTTKGSEGSGFGLPICRKIVEDNHHGKIWIDSKTQEGTTFFIKLPRQLLHQAAKTAEGEH